MNELRQRVKRYRLTDVRFDVGGGGALLPNRKAAPRRQPPVNPSMVAQELMRDHDPKRLTIAVGRRAILDGWGELARWLPQRVVFDPQPRRERTRARIGLDRHLGRIKIEADDPAANAGVLPLAIVMPGRHEGELAPENS